MEKFFKDLKEHATKIINYEKKEMIPVTKEEEKIHRRQKTATYAIKDLALMIAIKNIIK